MIWDFRFKKVGATGWSPFFILIYHFFILIRRFFVAIIPDEGVKGPIEDIITPSEAVK